MLRKRDAKPDAISGSPNASIRPTRLASTRRSTRRHSIGVTTKATAAADTA